MDMFLLLYLYKFRKFWIEHKSHKDNYFNCLALYGRGLHFHLPQSNCDVHH